MLSWLRRRFIRRKCPVPPPPQERPLVDPLEILLIEVFSEWEARRYPPIAKDFERWVHDSSSGVRNIGSVQVDVGTLGRRDDFAWLDVGYGFAVDDHTPVLDPERCAKAFWACSEYTTDTEVVVLVSRAPVSEKSFADLLLEFTDVEFAPAKPTDSPVWIQTLDAIWANVLLFVVVDISAAQGPEECRRLFEIARDLCGQHFDDPYWESLGVADGDA